MLLENNNQDMNSNNQPKSSLKNGGTGEQSHHQHMSQPASGPYYTYPSRKLYRSTRDKWIAGVCGGIAENYNIDPVMVRLLWIIVTIFSVGAGIIGYILFWIFVDKYPSYNYPPAVVTTPATSKHGTIHYHYHGKPTQ
jgi:phage shock protein C